jgi:flagellar protein FliO/FliZ
MTGMVIRLILSLVLVGAALWFAARIAKRRGIGQGQGLIEVVARQRMGRSSSVNLIRVADVVLVVGATDEQVTLLAEVDGEAVEAALAEREAQRPAQRAPRGGGLHAALPSDGTPAVGEDGEPLSVPAPRASRVVARQGSGALAGSVFDRTGWGSFVGQLRERSVRRP